MIERKSGDGGNRTHARFPSTLPLALAVVVAWLTLFAATAQAACRHSHACWHRVHIKRQHHWCRTHIWECRWHRVDPWLKSALSRLRFCESRHNYRAVNGQYTGAYQYAASTWARAGGHGLAMYAPPREQDVRTAWFWPSHRSEWECKA